MEVIYEGRGRWAQYLNGKLGGRGTFGNRTFLGFRKPIRLAIGQHADITSANTFYRGDLAEVLLYNRAPAPDERNALGDYLSRKYGIETTYGPLPRFEKDVAPILARHCQKCHAQRSYFLEMIDSGEMPPEGEKRLAKEDVALLRRWVQLGAPTDERIVLTKTADFYDANPKTRTASSELTEAWRYRDWVVNSFNRDLPFDRFIVHQIAGDLLSDPAGGEIYPDGLVATTFLSNGVWDRGDADKEKIVSDMVDDQIDTIGKAFLGLALGCPKHRWRWPFRKAARPAGCFRGSKTCRFTFAAVTPAWAE